MVKCGNGVCLLLCMLVPYVLTKPTETESKPTTEAPKATTEAAPNPKTTTKAVSNETEDIFEKMSADLELTGWNPTDPDRRKILEKVVLYGFHIIGQKLINGTHVNVTFKEEISKRATERADFLAREIVEKLMHNTTFNLTNYKPNPLYFSEVVGYTGNSNNSGEDDELLKGVLNDLYFDTAYIIKTATENKEGAHEKEGEADAKKGETDAKKGEADAKKGEADAKKGETDAKKGEADKKEGNTTVTDKQEADQEEGINPLFVPKNKYAGLGFAKNEVKKEEKTVYTVYVVVLNIGGEEELTVFNNRNKTEGQTKDKEASEEKSNHTKKPEEENKTSEEKPK